MLASVSLMLAMPAFPQSSSPIPVVSGNVTVSQEQIETAIAAIEARDGLDDETRSSVIETLRDAQAQIQNAASHVAATAEYAGALTNAPTETARLRELLAAPPPAAPTPDSLGIDESTPLAELEQSLARTRASLSSAETALSDLEKQINAEQDRPAQARQRIEELRASRAELEQIAGTDPAPGENALLGEARVLAARTSIGAQTAEIGRLEEELSSHSVRLELLRAQRDMQARQVADERRSAAVLQVAVNAARQNDALRLLSEAALTELSVADKHPAVQAIAAETVAFGSELPTVVADIERVTAQLDDVAAQSREIEQALTVSRQRLEVGGISQAIGRLFLEEKRNLPQVSQHRQRVRERRRLLADIGLAQVRIEEERRALTPIGTRVETIMSEVAADDTDAAELEAIQADVQRLLADRRELLVQMARTYTTYLRALSDIDIAEKRLLKVAEEYKTFLDQHLLWTPNAPVINAQTIKDTGPATAWMLSPASWLDAAEDFANTTPMHPVVLGLVLVFLATYVLIHRRLRRSMKAINEKVGRLSTDSILLTLQALGLSAVFALPVPLALGTIGWVLRNAPDSAAFSQAVAVALAGTAPFLYNVRLLRVLAGPAGVLRVHFNWRDDGLPKIRQQLDFLIAFGVPIVFVTILAYLSPEPADRDSVGRLAFVALMVVFGLFFYRLADPRSGLVKDYYDRYPDRWHSRLKWLWYLLEIGTPAALAILALLGFLYTAVTLTGQFVDTVWLALSIVLINLVVLRWLSLTKRKLALQRALEAREARLAELAEEHKAEGAEHEGQDGPPIPERKPVDLDDVDQQTRRLLQSGLFVLGVLGTWGIWSDVLPALGVLEEVTLWSETVTVNGQTVVKPTTLADLLLALVVLAVTWVASRNLPGLMEIAILQRLDLQPGSRYTINTLLRYVVVTVGVIVVLNIIGWSWSRIQWLVAALSVGLGFGLQEIVANFISGLIILFERPVRVGDTVTVGNLTGSVSKVRIRATTITDWDRKEIIVPNKAFITDQVINWTLSDPITRVVVDVGISYGSDVVLARKVMEDTLSTQPLILDEPPPSVYFLGFGDSSLNFRLYVYARQLGDRLPLMHAVHEDILTALRANGIEIPFPQRDLHVRSVDKDVSWRVGDDAPERSED